MFSLVKNESSFKGTVHQKRDPIVYIEKVSHYTVSLAAIVKIVA